MHAIALCGSLPYSAGMLPGVQRLLMVLALLFMPIGMAVTPAYANAGATAESGHCGSEQKPVDGAPMPKAHCAACTALPAVNPCALTAMLQPSMPMQVEAVQWVSEPGPETDTPPPKLA